MKVVVVREFHKPFLGGNLNMRCCPNSALPISTGNGNPGVSDE